MYMFLDGIHMHLRLPMHVNQLRYRYKRHAATTQLECPDKNSVLYRSNAHRENEYEAGYSTRYKVPTTDFWILICRAHSSRLQRD